MRHNRPVDATVSAASLASVCVRSAAQRRAVPRRGPGRRRSPPGRPASGTAPAAGASSSSATTPLVGDRAVVGLPHHQVLVGERGHLRQVGDHDHLGAAGQPGQPAADLDRRPAADPGVDLVEHQRRHRVACRRGRPRAPASPGTARRRRRPSAAGAPGAPGCAAKQQLDLVDPVRADAARRRRRAASTDRARVRHRQHRSAAASRAPASSPLTARAALAAGRAAVGRPSSATAPRQLVPLGGQQLDPLVVAVQLGQPGRGLLRPGEHLVDVPCSRRTCGSAGQRGPPLAAPPPAGPGRRRRSGVRRPARRPGRRPGSRARRPGRPARPARGRAGAPRPATRAWPAASSADHVVSAGSVRVPGGSASRGRARPRSAGRRRAPAAPPRRAARRPRPAAGSTARSRPGRSAAGPPPGARSRVPGWSARSARPATSRMPLVGRGVLRSGTSSARRRTGPGPPAAGRAQQPQLVGLAVHRDQVARPSSASSPTGTARPPRCARDGPRP